MGWMRVHLLYQAQCLPTRLCLADSMRSFFPTSDLSIVSTTHVEHDPVCRARCRVSSPILPRLAITACRSQPKAHIFRIRVIYDLEIAFLRTREPAAPVIR